MNNELFSSLVTNKKIAIIGPAPHLEGRNLGNFIDSYDVVCRINELHVPQKYEKSYGSKTNVVFHNLNSTDGVRDFKRDLKLYPKQSESLDMIICPQKSHDDAGVNIINLFQEYNLYNTPLLHVGDNFVHAACTIAGAKVNTGIISILYLLQFQIKELFVSVFSFYNEGIMSTDSYREDISLQGGLAYKCGEASHPQAPQKELFKKLLSEYPTIIKIDSYLKNILGVEHQNVHNL